jgi:hypothetical protein
MPTKAINLMLQLAKKTSIGTPNDIYHQFHCHQSHSTAQPSKEFQPFQKDANH